MNSISMHLIEHQISYIRKNPISVIELHWMMMATLEIGWMIHKQTHQFSHMKKLRYLGKHYIDVN